ncbi:hypothetical protein ACIQ7D_10340 [Streptomyces sp. NPDC096310]|uniref:hypothetical protein n=1 Tax=Streptomyces sp. NPDC096310 TaxID=3366082 RepID=UPI003805019C
MFHRIRRRAAELNEAEGQFFELSARLQQPDSPEAERVWAELERGKQFAAVDDFLPPELRVPSRDQLGGMMMPWTQPLVLDGEMVACSECGAYRDWLILCTRDQVWLRCRAGHQQLETRLDTAWYNRNSGPTVSRHATFEDCLRHHGH